MRKYSYFISAALLGIMFLVSCNQVEETGQLKFGLDLTEDATYKAATDDKEVVAALVTIQDINGMVVYEKEYLELIHFGEKFVTRSLKLSAGEFMLTEFMLLGADGSVVWATPKEGSNLAHLVREPLPRYFAIHPDETTSLDLQVVRVKNYNPSDFGYAEFNIDFVDRFCLKVYFNCDCMMIANDSTPSWDEAGVPIYQPRIVIWAGDQLVLDEPLQAGVNHYNISRVHTYYSVMAFGYHEELLFEAKFGIEELKKFRCGPDFPPLIIDHEPYPYPGVIITPEDLMEPGIKQGVFGQITIPVIDTTTFTERYDIFPVVRDIYFFRPGLLDSIYTFAPINCYIGPDMIWDEPVAIVRSNSRGYFQVPLEEGEYLYMVRTEYGYYIDAYMSSRMPGQVTVHQGKVTELSIHIVGCSMW
jgi:hypothetical protein